MTTELQAHYRIHSCRPPKGRRRRGLAGVFWLLLGGAAALSFPADQPRAMTAVFGRMLHVAPSGADGNDGASWASPLLTIARAVEAAGVGDTIAVSNGTYEITAQIRVSKGVIIRGIGRSPDDVVIKRKSNNVRIFELDHVNARIENLTVSGGIITGTSGKGGNILIASGGGAVVGCIIRDGVVTSGVGVIGAGVHVASDAGLVSGCLITNNYTKDYNSDGGAGLSMEKGRVVNCIIADNAQHVTTVNTTKPTGAVRMTGGELIHCTITRNQMYGGTAGVYATGGRVVNCIIAGNKADDNGSKGGCGIAMEAAGRIENCLIAGNVTTLALGIAGREDQKAAGGVYMTDGSLVNCTIVDNRSLNVGGVYLTGGAVTNCIISGNTSEGTKGGATARVYDGDAARFVNCASADLLINATCVIGPMHFAGSETGNFRLLPGSVAIDAGAMDVGGILFGTDLDGKPRVEHGIIDIGCYETTWLPPATMLLIR